MSVVEDYLRNVKAENIDTGMLAYICNLSELAKVRPDAASSIVRELENQRNNIKLIASENYCSLPCQLAMGNLLTDKYAEGVPHHRFYAGNENVDAIEEMAQNAAKALFGAEYANVQPHCGADANMLAYWAILASRVEQPLLEKLSKKNLYELDDTAWKQLKLELGCQKLLGLDYYSGGHLTHGYRYNMSAKLFEVHGYTVDKDTKLLDYDAIEKQALEVRPLILLGGYSAYPRKVNFRRMKEIADKVGAVFMVDMAHFGGLVAGGVFTGEYSPFPYADIVTSTTHKTLRGPRSGFVLSKKEFAGALDKGCPMTMGGPLPHVIAAKAVAFTEAMSAEFKSYAHNIVKNSQSMARACEANGLDILTGGTDNHLFLADVHKLGISGKQAEAACYASNITLNRNSLPFDPNGPWYTSGLRIGTAAITSLGMGEKEALEIGNIISLVVKNIVPAKKAGDSTRNSMINFTLKDDVKNEAKARVKTLLGKYPVYPNLDLDFLKKAFVKS
jgi:glycine hydroxymethyltransferase